MSTRQAICNYVKYVLDTIILSMLVVGFAIAQQRWERNYGGAGWDEGHFVHQTQDGGYIVLGTTESFGNNKQVYLIKTDSTGAPLWTRTHGGGGDEWGNSVQQTTDGGYIIAGWTESFGNGRQVYLVKTDVNGYTGVEEGSDQRCHIVQDVKIIPNPFTSYTVLLGHKTEGYKIYDISGKLIEVCRGSRVGEDLAPGIYFLRSNRVNAMPLRIIKIR